MKFVHHAYELERNLHAIFGENSEYYVHISRVRHRCRIHRAQHTLPASARAMGCLVAVIGASRQQSRGFQERCALVGCTVAL